MKQSKLSLIDNDKGRATCIISNTKKQELVNKELKIQNDANS